MYNNYVVCNYEPAGNKFSFKNTPKNVMPLKENNVKSSKTKTK
jgi:hypothetical protein